MTSVQCIPTYFVQQRDPSEGSEGVIQASERVSEEMQEQAEAGDPQSRVSV